MEIGYDKKFNFYCHSMLGEKIIDSYLHSHTQVGRLLPNSKRRQNSLCEIFADAPFAERMEQSWPTQVWTT
jgi:hypothetical protein